MAVTQITKSRSVGANFSDLLGFGGRLKQIRKQEISPLEQYQQAVKEYTDLRKKGNFFEQLIAMFIEPGNALKEVLDREIKNFRNTHGSNVSKDKLSEHLDKQAGRMFDDANKQIQQARGQAAFGVFIALQSLWGGLNSGGLFTGLASAAQSLTINQAVLYLVGRHFADSRAHGKKWAHNSFYETVGTSLISFLADSMTGHLTQSIFSRVDQYGHTDQFLPTLMSMIIPGRGLQASMPQQ